MSAESLAKRIKHIFMLCLFSGLCGLGKTVVNSIQVHFFTGLPLLALLIIAEGIIFWMAFKSDSLEKALNQISVLKIIALVLAAYSAYSLVMYFVRIWGNSSNLFEIWFMMVSEVSSIFASLAVYATAKTLKAGDTKKFSTTTGILLIVDILLIFCVTVAALIVSEMMIPILIGIIVFIFMFSVVPKALGNKVVNAS